MKESDQGVPERPQSGLQRVREWALGRPAVAARRAPNLTWLTRGVLTSGAAAALVVVLAGGLVLTSAAGSGDGRPAPVAGAGTGDLNASPALSSSEYPTLDTYATWSSDSPSPSITPVDPSHEAFANIVGQLACDNGGHAVANGRLYVSCTSEVIAIDLATNEVVARYGGLWQNNVCPMACVGPPPHTVILDGNGGFWTSATIGWKNFTKRFDIASGKVTTTVNGWIVGGGNGDLYVWDNGLRDIKLADGSAGGHTVPGSFASPGAGPIYDYQNQWTGEIRVVCGSLMTDRIENGQTLLSHAGWEGDIAEPGTIVDVVDFAGGCWALFADGPLVDYQWNGPYHLARITDTGIDRRSPELPRLVQGWNDALWIDPTPGPATAGASSTYQRLDWNTWQLVGVPWVLPACYSPFGAGGVLWCYSADNLLRLDVPVDGGAVPLSPLPSSGPSPAPTATPTPKPSASPRVSASPSPKPSATKPSPTASPHK